ncbi:BGTF surface domain-containing protein [Natrialbaceae archaeon GCM10025810]|uniref:BGTF surface domain-containing protein n=1 Tax=Halovalidus salilacus TaxID=3075124 RepID=UPI00360F81DC
MTSDSTYRDKGRALFFAAMMVLSVFAMSAAFAGGAAAVEDDGTLNAEDVNIEGDDPQDQRVEFNATNGTDFDASDDGSHNITFEEVDGLDFDSVDVESAENSSGDPFDGDGSGVTADIVDNGDDPDTVEVNVSEDDLDSEDFGDEGELAIALDLDVDTDDADRGDSAYEVVSEGDDDSTEEAEFTIADEEADDSTQYAGQMLTADVSDLTNGEDAELRTVEDGEVGSLENTPHVFNDTTSFDTDSLDNGQYVVTDNGSGDKVDDKDVEFELVEQDLDAEFADEEVKNDGSDADTELDVSSDVRNDYDVRLSADGLDDEDLDDIFDGDESGVDVDEDDDTVTIEDAEDGIDADFTDIDTDEYDFDVEVVDSTAEASASVDVTEAGDQTAEFSESDFSEVRSNTAEITVDLEETDTGYMKVGDEEEAGYETYLDLSDEDDDGEVTVQMDTTEAHNANDDEGDTNGDIFWADGDDDEVTIENATDDNVPDDPLEAGEYEIAASTDYEDDDNYEAFDDAETDSAYLVLEDREGLDEDAIATHVAPEDADVSDIDDFEDETITESDMLADEDKLFVTVESDSLYTYFDGAEDFDDVDDDIQLNLTEQGSSLNAEEDEWSTNASDSDYNISENVSVVDANQSNGEMIFAVDYEDFNEDLNEEDYEAAFSLDHENEYATEEAADDEEDEEATTEFGIEEREFELDDSNEELPASEDAEVTGETNVAPGTEVDDRIRASGEFTETSDAEVDDDGTYTLTHDLSEYDAGIEYELSAEEQGGEEDDLEGELVEADGEGDEKEDELELDVDAPSEIDEGDAAEFDVTVDNNKDEETTATVELTIGDETYDEELDIDGEDSESTTLEAEDLDAGDHDWEVTADNGDFDVSEDGTLTVNEDTSSDDDDSSSDDDDSSSDDDDSSSDDDDSSSDDDDEDGSPGFGVAVALVALLAAAMLALRRQD